MSNKILSVLLAVTLIISLGSLWGVTLLNKSTLLIPEQIIEIRKDVANIKGGLPPFWGGWPAQGWMVKVEDGPTVYFAGDTDLMINWEAIRDFYAPDIVVATHSKIYQMGVEEWVYAINIIQPSYVLASHHNSFPFYPKDDSDFVIAMNERTPATGVTLPAPGEQFEIMGLEFTWLGHSGFVMETPNGSRIVLDPEWKAVNAANYPPQYKTAEGLAADLILITHGHFDHFNPEVLRILLQPRGDRISYLAQLFEFSAFTQKLIPEAAARGQLLPINLGVWITAEDMSNAYGVSDSYPDDVQIAGIFATHSSGILSTIR